MNMNKQPIKPIKTSFWDFKHKKFYTSRKEKFIDFIASAILIDLLVCIFTDLWCGTRFDTSF